MKIKIEIAIIIIMGVILGVNAQDYVPKTGGVFTGKIGVGIKTNPEVNLQIGNLQIGEGTVKGLITLGGGKGYAAIGSTRSDGCLILGKNIYTKYGGAEDNYIARVGKTGSNGFSGIKLGLNGQIDFFGKSGDVVSEDIANSNDNIKLRIDKSGSVGIGTLNLSEGYKLAVNGKIKTKEIKVTLKRWSDFVFYDNYKLPKLEEVEKHIKEKGYLKDIPSAKEVKENGIFLGEMNAKLLQKIEELTLYVIKQNKRLKYQKEEIESLKKENENVKSLNLKLFEIQKRLEKLENNK